MRFLFPFLRIPHGSRIVLYGAGEVGYDFFRQIKTSGFVELALWVDRQYEWFRMLNLPVDAPEKMLDMQYDFVLITAERKSVYQSIWKDLNNMGVEDEKIVWQEDYTIHENIVKCYEDRDIQNELKNSVEIDPHCFIHSQRLDIVIRYLYAADLLKGIEEGYHKALYTKFMVSGCNAKEPTENYISAYFSEYALKRGIKAFHDSYIDLVLSMKKRGYLMEHFVPLDSKGRLINGAHRVAAAVACEINVWSVTYPFNGLEYVCDTGTLADIGFMNSEIHYIVDVLHSMQECSHYKGTTTTEMAIGFYMQ